MINHLKNLWAKWKVQISVIGGAIIIATAWGTCTVQPAQVEEAEESSESSEEAVEEVSNSSVAPTGNETISAVDENGEASTTNVTNTIVTSEDDN